MKENKYSYYLFALLILALLAPLGFMSYSALYTKSAIFMSGMLFLLLLWKAASGPQNTQLKTQAAKGTQKGPQIVDLDKANSVPKEAFGAGAVEGKQTENNSFQNHKALKTRRHPFEQELWNLPGFQSLLRPFKKGISADEFNLLEWESLYSDSTPSRLSSEQAYSFRTFEIYSQGITSLNNLEAFVKEMLLSLAEYLRPCSVSACLRSRTGKYHLFLQLSGSVFFSEKSTEMKGETWQKLIQGIESGEYVILNEGKELAFPLPSRCGPLGFLYFRCEESWRDNDDNKEILEKLWCTIRKYGEGLLQACIYEQSTRDPESTLLNGMRFQEDLSREMACRLERNVPSHLILILLRGEIEPEAIDFCGKNLPLLFPFPQRVYRIGQNLFSILDSRNPGELKLKLSEFCTRMHQNFSLDILLSSAIPSLDLSTPQEWFEQAQKDLY